MQNHCNYSVIYPPNRPMEEITAQPSSPLTDGFLYFIEFNKRGMIWFHTLMQ